MSGPETRRYRTPHGARLQVDIALSVEVLDRLNKLPKLRVYSVCAGHSAGPGDRQAHVIFTARRFTDLQPYCRRLSTTGTPARVEFYAGNGERATWHLEARRDEVGEAPPDWWHGLVDDLEDNSDQWMS